MERRVRGPRNVLAIETVMRRGERPIEAGPAPELLRLRSVVRGSTGGLQSSARCSSNRVTGGGGTELSPAAGLSCLATLTKIARFRALFAPLAPPSPGAIKARTPAFSPAVLARGTGLARSLGIKSALGRTGGACASEKCNECNWERETGRQVRERRPIRQCDPSQCDLSQHASGRGYVFEPQAVCT